MAERRLLVYGAGGHAKVVADAAISMGYRVMGFLDADPSKVGLRVLGLPVLLADAGEAVAVCRDKDAEVVVAVGANAARMRVFETLRSASVPIATIIHARAVVAGSAVVGEGTVVFAGVVVNPETRVGRNVILNTSASVDHDNRIGDHAHLSPGVHTGGTVTVGEGTHVGIGASIRNNIEIGAWSVVGAGSVVVKDLPDSVVAYGVPARIVRPSAQPACETKGDVPLP
jgi:acetyltransferase EpsM